MTPASATSQQGMDLRYYWLLIRQKLWVIVPCAIVGSAIGLIQAVQTRPLYQATVQLLIDGENPNMATSDTGVPPDRATDYYQTQYQLLQNRSMARQVIETLQLQSHAEFAPAPPQADLIQDIVQQVRGLVKALLARLPAWLPGRLAPAVSGGAEQAQSAFDLSPEGALVSAFLTRLKVEPIPDSRLVNVRFEAYDPHLPANVVNTLARLYIDQNLERRSAALQETYEWLSKPVRELRQQVATGELAIQRYKEKHDIVSLEERQNVVVQQLADLNTTLTQAKAERIGQETLYRKLQQLARQPDMIELLPSVVDSALVQSLVNTYATLQQTLAQSVQKYGSAHPHMLELRSQIDATQKMIQTEVQKVAHAVQVKYEVAKSREETLRQALEQQKREAQKLNNKAIQYDALIRDVESNKRLYEVLLTRMQETGIGSELKSSNIRIVEPAWVPRTPSNASLVWSVFRAGLIGLVLGVSLVLSLDYLNSALKTPEQAEALLGLPVIGVIRHFKRKRPTKNQPSTALITQQQPRSPTAEAFKALRTNLLFNHTAQPRKVVLVTSPHPKDGKTTVAANLAMVMAQMERRVLLIDADLHNPTLHKLFGLSNAGGLSEVLVSERDAGQLQALVGNLTVLPAGTPPPNPAELLGSKRMQHFLTFACQQYDMVIIDSPPILAVSDALVLSTLVDGCLLVCKTGVTPCEHARRAVAQLALLHQAEPTNGSRATNGSGTPRCLGVVMNFLDPRAGSGYDYSYYKAYARNGQTH